jgi:hypothetical protein
MNLKAAAQKLRLENGSLGWAILEKLASETDQGVEWNEIWDALVTGHASNNLPIYEILLKPQLQATLLLPLEQSSETITADLVKSHVVFCNEL